MAQTKEWNKARAQRAHAKNRAKERYGIDINRHDQRTLVDMIQTKQTVCLEVQSNRISIHKCKFKDTVVKFVYDRTRSTIVSFLPLEPKADKNEALQTTA